ncbi:malonyl-CoA decarboxylase-domain-containing protein [Zopfochytrium polystomum]|nr:malonyl-CoA decarboxylase-domain-containing protein [Zopfochytrium polystomum]
MSLQILVRPGSAATRITATTTATATTTSTIRSSSSSSSSRGDAAAVAAAAVTARRSVTAIYYEPLPRIRSSPRIRFLPAASRRSFSSSASTSTSSSSSHSPPNLSSEIVAAYWAAVMKSTKDPDFDLAPAFARVDPFSSSDDDASIRDLLDRATRASRRSAGDLYPQLLARHCLEFYDALDLDDGRRRFLHILARDFGVSRDRVVDRAKAVIAAAAVIDGGGGGGAEGADETPSPRAALKAEQALRDALVPAYQQFFVNVGQLPNGVAFLLKMRADVLTLLAKQPSSPSAPYLRAIDDTLKSLLQSLFAMSQLDLARITWTSPAAVLEKIIKYEAVHAIPSWQDLKQRLGPGRLCYAFFHRELPTEPLTFIEVALLKEIEWNVHRIITDPDPLDVSSEFRVAVFYSISSTQRGLAGVDLGNFLIKRVVKEIQALHPTVTTFCTLSPIPGFRTWLDTRLRLPNGVETLLLPDEADALTRKVPGSAAPISALQTLLAEEDWHARPESAEFLKPIVTRLCAQYVLLEKKRSFALDPVANFHIRNGACVHRLNWLGDVSAKGLTQSYGLMINYVYLLPHIERNNQAYLLDGTIPVVEPVSSTLRWACQAAAAGGAAAARVKRVGAEKEEAAAVGSPGSVGKL